LNEQGQDAPKLFNVEISTRFSNITDAGMVDQMQIYSPKCNARWVVDYNWAHKFYVFLRLDNSEGQVLAS
jgi:hypothetical protein